MSDRVPISAEVREHVEGELLGACRRFREYAEQLSNPLARSTLLEMADELDADVEKTLNG